MSNEVQSAGVGIESVGDFIAFYPASVDGSYLDVECVVSQPGDSYGGWIPSDLVGPFRDASNTRG